MQRLNLLKDGTLGENLHRWLEKYTTRAEVARRGYERRLHLAEVPMPGTRVKFFAASNGVLPNILLQPPRWLPYFNKPTP